MRNSSKKIVLLANGPMTNRGNEAILIGTEKIIRRYIPDAEIVLYSVFAGPDFLHDQVAKVCQSINIRPMFSRMPSKRFDFNWIVSNTLKRISKRLASAFLFCGLKNELKDASAALSLGGDLYTLSSDNQPLRVFYSMDDVVKRVGVKYAYWGASVGPFSANPKFERYFKSHVEGIYVFVREVATLDYLKQIGKHENELFLVSDPAFTMPASEPELKSAIGGGSIPDDSIGLNLNAYVLRYFDSATYPYQKWLDDCLKVVEMCLDKCSGRVYLIPHVTSWLKNPAFFCDYFFMKALFENLPARSKERVVLVGDNLGAQQIKWLISKMKLFIGARTHATIAAFSTCVPTVSISYSSKSKGINLDLFGSLDYCVDAECIAKDMSKLEAAVSKAIANSEHLRSVLSEKIVPYVERAYKAGEYLDKIICG